MSQQLVSFPLCEAMEEPEYCKQEYRISDFFLVKSSGLVFSKTQIPFEEHDACLISSGTCWGAGKWIMNCFIVYVLRDLGQHSLTFEAV